MKMIASECHTYLGFFCLLSLSNRFAGSPVLPVASALKLAVVAFSWKRKENILAEGVFAYTSWRS